VISALYVETDGHYFNLEGVDPWDAERDARKCDDMYAVVAHPPCYLWVNLAAVNWKRYRRELPAWYPGGSDGGCFEHALRAVRKNGGVMEHPAFTHAWKKYELVAPVAGNCEDWDGIGWLRAGEREWVCEVWQSAYGHAARKRTWLYYVGPKPFDLRWERNSGTHQVGWFDRNKPTLSKKEASRTPIAFRDELLRLARYSGEP
jgi:hypothetical protein